MLTAAQNNSNSADLVGEAFETSEAFGGVRILRNTNIISKGRGKALFPKGVKLEGN